MSKVVGLGMHKTGTTSLGKALRMLGYTWSGWKCETASIYKRGHINALLDMMEDFDCFEDTPWYLMYSDIYHRYPDVKFVLTLRSDMNEWFDSLCKHAKRRGASKFSFLDIIYGTEDVLSNKALFIQRHKEHIASVRKFCADNDIPLLEVCWEEGDGWQALCSFLGKEVPSFKFPHANSTLSRSNSLFRYLFK